MAGINYELKSATVEWFEQGETKGKEVDMIAIESLNPDVVILKPVQENKVPDSPKLNQLQRVSLLGKNLTYWLGLPLCIVMCKCCTWHQT